MSATQLAAWIVAAALASVLGAGAAWLAVHSPPCGTSQLITRHGLMAGALGLLAGAVLGLGVLVARGPEAAPVWSGRCGPGLYDNGGAPYNGPICIPWPSGGPR